MNATLNTSLSAAFLALLLLAPTGGCLHSQAARDGDTPDAEAQTLARACDETSRDLDALQDELKAVERLLGQPLPSPIHTAFGHARMAIQQQDLDAAATHYHTVTTLAHGLLIDEDALAAFRQALFNIERRLGQSPCAETWDDLLAIQTRARLRRIVIPELSFAPPQTLADAIDFFKQASRDHDSPELPASRRGLSFILKPAATPAAGSDPFATADTLPPIPPINARFITLHDALRLVCDATGHTFSTRGGLVLIAPPEND